MYLLSVHKDPYSVVLSGIVSGITCGVWLTVALGFVHKATVADIELVMEGVDHFDRDKGRDTAAACSARAWVPSVYVNFPRKIERQHLGIVDVFHNLAVSAILPGWGRGGITFSSVGIYDAVTFDLSSLNTIGGSKYVPLHVTVGRRLSTKTVLRRKEMKAERGVRSGEDEPSVLTWEKGVNCAIFGGGKNHDNPWKWLNMALLQPSRCV
ncbi:hypothetical protein K438DRAFT_1777142 [Mycena galopus ATCC 62051]|nr:hypothetical protein K438DRAFT_1777142 [Mycena galopus ATCC 62051]